MKYREKYFALIIVMFALVAQVVCGAESQNCADESTPQEHVGTGQRIADGLRALGWPDAAIVVAISALPIVELRGAIPVGHILMLADENDAKPAGSERIRKAVKIYALAVIGNMIPIPFILLLLGPVSKFLMRYKVGRIFFEWLFARTRRKTAGIEKYETLGLTIFVAIPLPVTGGWTGSMAAFLMGIEFKHAMLAILAGVMIAGIIMTVVSFLGWIGAAIAGVVLICLVISAMMPMFKRD